MSMSPNNPFENPQNDPAGGQGVAPAKKSKKGCLIAFLVTGVLGVVVCCGGVVMLMNLGLGVLASEYERQLAGNPVMEEQIGEIESFEHSMSGTFTAAQQAEEAGDQTPLAFEVKGSKGEGQVLILQDQSGDGTGIASATLVMPDGSRFPLDVDDDGGDDLEFDLEMGDLIDTGDAEGNDSSSETEAESGSESSETTEPAETN